MVSVEFNVDSIWNLSAEIQIGLCVVHLVWACRFFWVYSVAWQRKSIVYTEGRCTRVFSIHDSVLKNVLAYLFELMCTFGVLRINEFWRMHVHFFRFFAFLCILFVIMYFLAKCECGFLPNVHVFFSNICIFWVMTYFWWFFSYFIECVLISLTYFRFIQRDKWIELYFDFVSQSI